MKFPYNPYLVTSISEQNCHEVASNSKGAWPVPLLLQTLLGFFPARKQERMHLPQAEIRNSIKKMSRQKDQSLEESVGQFKLGELLYVGSFCVLLFKR